MAQHLQSRLSRPLGGSVKVENLETFILTWRLSDLRDLNIKGVGGAALSNRGALYVGVIKLLKFSHLVVFKNLLDKDTPASLIEKSHLFGKNDKLIPLSNFREGKSLLNEIDTNTVFNKPENLREAGRNRGVLTSFGRLTPMPTVLLILGSTISLVDLP
jgi:hypothetical protein